MIALCRLKLVMHSSQPMPMKLNALPTVRSSCHDRLEAGMFVFLWLTWLIWCMHVCRVGLDVFEDEPNMKPGLAECDNCVIVPHIASASFWTRAGMVSRSHFVNMTSLWI